ncbi:MAG: response regulator [Candidatus Omnitrophica bacterium]|nr:response regulator [Candidatus Omnitrophota bacterium]
MYKKKILLIDDEEDFCRLVKMNLELIGNFEVNSATNGKQGLKLAKKLKPDLILLDIMMPGINGFEVLERLKKDQDTVQIPVVMLTAKEDEPSKIKASELYDELYLTKPIEAPDLKAKIDEILKMRGVG